MGIAQYCYCVEGTNVINLNIHACIQRRVQKNMLDLLAFLWFCVFWFQVILKTKYDEYEIPVSWINLNLKLFYLIKHSSYTLHELWINVHVFCFCGVVYRSQTIVGHSGILSAISCCLAFNQIYFLRHPRYTEIVSKSSTLVQASHSACSGKNTKWCFRFPTECPAAAISVLLDTLACNWACSNVSIGAWFCLKIDCGID